MNTKSTADHQIKWWAIIVFLACYILYSAQIAVAQSNDYITHFPAGSFNWTTGIVTATGSAVPEKSEKKDTYESVHKAALHDAESKIITILKRLGINNSLTVGDYANPVIPAGLEQIGREATISKQIYTSAMAVDITLETSIFGGFLQLVLPGEIRQLPLVTPVIHQNKDMTDNEPYTGLIVDARGLGLEPVLNPTIINDHGQAVYSSAFISREYAVQEGVCKYIRYTDKMLADPRTGSNPLMLKALRREGKRKATLVISMADYEILEKVTERHGFFSECRVIIILE